MAATRDDNVLHSAWQLLAPVRSLLARESAGAPEHRNEIQQVVRARGKGFDQVTGKKHPSARAPKPTDHWCTPIEIIEAATDEYGLLRDTCWNRNCHLDFGFAIGWDDRAHLAPGETDDNAFCDGLSVSWAPARVADTGVRWCNPPYSYPKPWCEKAAAEARQGARILMLVKCDPSTAWWQALAESADWASFPKRIRFAGAPSAANFPCAFVGFNIAKPRNREVFGDTMVWTRRAA
jgi:hypothetical protein